MHGVCNSHCLGRIACFLHSTHELTKLSDYIASYIGARHKILLIYSYVLPLVTVILM